MPMRIGRWFSSPPPPPPPQERTDMSKKRGRGRCRLLDAIQCDGAQAVCVGGRIARLSPLAKRPALWLFGADAGPQSGRIRAILRPSLLAHAGWLKIRRLQ